MNKFFRYKVHHILVWVSAFFLWREYYRVVDPPQMTWVFAGICTAFAATTFYLTYLFLTPILLYKRNVKKFLAGVFLLLIVLACLRSASIYIAFKIILPDVMYWRLFNSITASTFHIGYAITIAILARLFIERYETQNKLDDIAKNNLRSELNYLKSQVNPHFLFNIHNSIYFLMEENSSKAGEVLLRLSDIMKYQLYECNQETVSLNREVNNITNYVELEKMRIEEAVKVEFTSSIKNNGLQIAPFMLLPIIENTFKHVSQDGDRKNEIKISISLNGEWISLNTENTIGPLDIQHENGLGLKNTRRRLELLYPGNHEMLTHIVDGKYEAKLKLKLQNAQMPHRR